MQYFVKGTPLHFVIITDKTSFETVHAAVFRSIGKLEYLGRFLPFSANIFSCIKSSKSIKKIMYKIFFSSQLSFTKHKISFQYSFKLKGL